jgi:hypothetical protein
MKRFIGLVMAIAGAVAALWGGYHVVMGESSTHIALTNDFSVSAMAAGLAGVAVFTVGLVWCRD